MNPLLTVKEPTTVKITLEPERCVGAGHCVLSAPEVFDQDETDGIVVLLAPAPNAALADAVHEAADLCPARAILVDGGDGTP
ncbi:ferredoxin [Streptomyces sp. NPDC057623]|uniref:ferredoxin n=1 Tax=Streptomyces sp. NPDC057623 TaxID=3346187 RepID=UPI0036AEFA58